MLSLILGFGTLLTGITAIDDEFSANSGCDDCAGTGDGGSDWDQVGDPWRGDQG